MELVNFSDDWIITTGIRMEFHDSKKVIMNADIKTGFKYGIINLHYSIILIFFFEIELKRYSFSILKVTETLLPSWYS